MQRSRPSQGEERNISSAVRSFRPFPASSRRGEEIHGRHPTVPGSLAAHRAVPQRAFHRDRLLVFADPDDAADTIVLDGTALTAGNAIDSPGTAGDFMCLLAIDATLWLSLGRSGTWVDGGAD